MDPRPETPKKLEIEISGLTLEQGEALLDLIVRAVELSVPDALVVGGVVDDTDEGEAGDEPAQSA